MWRSGLHQLWVRGHHEVDTAPRARGAREGRVGVFFGGALRCLAGSGGRCLAGRAPTPKKLRLSDLAPGKVNKHVIKVGHQIEGDNL